ncbi:MAG TPA: hypothetical protein VIG99_06605 [Myxococcaceae bacterium]|jgi:hypothetical protein
MPYELSTFTLPCGTRAARVDFTGSLTGEEATGLMKNWEVGQPLYGLPTLVQTQEMKEMAPGARAVFGGWKETGPYEWYAIVINNPVIRVSANFIMRVSRTTRRRLFTSEAEAVQWLDEKIRQSAAPAG